MKREYTSWFSPLLNRHMELLTFGGSGIPVLFFPTRTARFYDYENWRIIDALKDKIECGQIQVFCVDSVDIESFYSSNHPAKRIERHLEYESYIVKEVIPYIKYQNRSNHRLVAAGCSLGGYHAANLAFKHPHLFSKVVGLSARYDLTMSSDKFPDLLSGYFDESVYFNMPSMFIPNISNENILADLRKLSVILAIGQDDPFLENNNHLERELRNKQVDVNLYVWDDEAHRPKYWRQMVQVYM